jgi:phospholipid transport system substrate-binding protein
VRSEGGSHKIVDVLVEGVSMALTQRADFASVIQRGGGNVEVLLEHLRK